MQGLELPSPRIVDFFNDVFNGEEEVIRTLQIVLGYGMTGSKACEIMVFWIGLGGKSASGKGQEEFFEIFRGHNSNQSDDSNTALIS